MATTILLQPAKPSSDFAQIENWAIETDQLSAMAFRVYAYIRSRPPGWKPYASEMAARWGVCVETVSNALQELKAAGILKHEPDRDQRTGRITGLLWRLVGVAHLMKPRKGKRASRAQNQAPPVPVQDRNYQALVKPDPGNIGSTNTEFTNLKFNQMNQSAPAGPEEIVKKCKNPDAPERPIEPPISPVSIAMSEDTKPGDVTRQQLNSGTIGHATSALVARCRQLAAKSAPPEYQRRLEERQKAEAREAQLRLVAEQEQASQKQKAYGRYLALPPAEAIEALCSDVLRNPDPKKDRRNVRALQAWAADKGVEHIKALVDCFRLAADQGAYSVRYVVKVWNSQQPCPIQLPL